MTAAELDAMRIVLDPLNQAGVGLALVLIMFSVALGLHIEDFRAILSRPVIFAGGVVAQILGLPLLTLALAFILEPPPSIALGMIVVAACPGGNVSNLMTHIARGDTALSVSLTATSSMIAAFLTPILILVWSSLYTPTATLLQSIEFNALGFVLQTTVLLAVPLSAGMAMARYAPATANRWRKPVSWAGALLLALMVVTGTWDLLPRMVAGLGLITGPVVIHSACAFGLGALAAFVLRADKPAGRTLTFEVGLQNSGLALIILIGQLEGLGGAAAVAAAWGVWHLIGGGAMVWLYRWRDRTAGAI